MTTFTGCWSCLDSGWAHVIGSDESRTVCDCPAGQRIAKYMADQRAVASESAFARMAPAFPIVHQDGFAADPGPHPLGSASLLGDEKELQGWSRPSVDRAQWSMPRFDTIGPPANVRAYLDFDDHRVDALRYAMMAFAGWRQPVPRADLTWVPVITMALIVFGLPALLAVLL